jgi:ribose transport system permease protein
MLKGKKLSTGSKSNSMHKFLALGSLIILYVFFSFFGNNFFSIATLVNVLDSSYYIGFLALGVTFVIITGGIDLSIGTVMMCGALIGGVAYNVWHWPIATALAVSVTVATFFGFLNGLMVAKLKLPSFIATLGTMMVTMGFGAIVSKVMTMRYPTVTDPDGWFKFVFYKTQGGFPIGAIWLLVFFILSFIVLNKTRLGRYTFAMGSNEEATRLSGVKVDNWKVMVYVISGFFAGLASIVYASAYTSIIPSTGNGIELLAISGVVIGGTSLSGGVGTVAGTIIGVYIMSVLKQGLMSMNLQGQWQTFFTGIVVIGAVLLDTYRNNKANQVKKD